PVSSMKAPRVPEPSSRDTTLMAWVASKSPAAAASVLSLEAASLEAAVLSEEAASLEEAVLSEEVEPQAARLRAIAAAQTKAILRFIRSSSPLHIHFQLGSAAAFTKRSCCGARSLSGRKCILPHPYVVFRPWLGTIQVKVLLNITPFCKDGVKFVKDM